VEVTQCKKKGKSADSSPELFILQAAVNENAEFIHTYVSNTPETDEEILEASKLCDKMASCCSGLLAKVVGAQKSKKYRKLCSDRHGFSPSRASLN